MNKGSPHLQISWSQSLEGILLKDVTELTITVDSQPLNEALLEWLSPYCGVKIVAIMREERYYYIRWENLIRLDAVISQIGRLKSHPILFIKDTLRRSINELDWGSISQLYLVTAQRFVHKSEYKEFTQLGLDISLVTQVGFWVLPQDTAWTNHTDMQQRCRKLTPCDRITIADDIIDHWDTTANIDTDRPTVGKPLMDAMRRNRHALKQYYDVCTTMMMIFVKRGGMDRSLCRYFLATYIKAEDWRKVTNSKAVYPSYVGFVRDSYQTLRAARTKIHIDRWQLDELREERIHCEKRLRELPDEIAKKEEEIALDAPIEEEVMQEFNSVIEYAKRARRGEKPRRGKFRYF